MRRGLTDELVEHSVAALPGGGLHAEEGGESESERQSEHPADVRALHDGTGERIANEPADERVRGELTGQLLQLLMVEGLHLEHLIVGKVIVINVRNPVPVLRR